MNDISLKETDPLVDMHLGDVAVEIVEVDQEGAE